MKSETKQKPQAVKKKQRAAPGKAFHVHGKRGGEPDPIEATIFVQDPEYAKQAAKARKERYAALGEVPRRRKTPIGMKRIKLDGETWLGAGPTTSRIEVIDIDEAEWGAPGTGQRWSPAKVLRSGDGFATGASKKASSRALRQVNVWAVVTHVLNHLESGKVFGRRLEWAFPGRLHIYPHYNAEDNACYHRESRGLFFGYFYHWDDRATKRNPVYLCLCHDTITHELGHAVLDGLKPYYAEEGNAQEAGFSEYFGDALAMTSALRMREVVAAVVGRDPAALDGKSLVSEIASQFGAVASSHTWEPQECLRSADNELKLRDVASGFERYEHAQVLNGAFYDVLQAIYAQELEREQAKDNAYKPGQRAVAALFNAADRTSRMMLRGLDYCPPCGLTFENYAQGVIRADEVAWPVDSRGYRAIAAKVFRKRGLVTSAARLRAPRTLANNALWSYDVDVLSASKPDAYEFLDRNREVLEIPRNVDIEIVRIYRTSKIAADGYRPPREVVVEFVWSEPWTLSGPEFGALEGTVRNVRCGGTIVFDTNHNVLHYCLSDFGPIRRQRMKKYLLHSIGSDAIAMEGDARSMHASKKLRAKVVDGVLELTRNPGTCHGGRGDAIEPT